MGSIIFKFFYLIRKLLKQVTFGLPMNKDVYSQYIHDDMILSDYIKNVFKHKNFEVLDINIKRSAKNLFINVCLFTPNHRLKNSVSELKTSLYYSDIINLKSYDYDTILSRLKHIIRIKIIIIH